MNLPECKIWIIGCRSEFVARHKEENEGGSLLEDIVQPLVLVRSGDLQKVDDDSGDNNMLIFILQKTLVF